MKFGVAVGAVLLASACSATGAAGSAAEADAPAGVRVDPCRQILDDFALALPPREDVDADDLRALDDLQVRSMEAMDDIGCRDDHYASVSNLACSWRARASSADPDISEALRRGACDLTEFG